MNNEEVFLQPTDRTSYGSIVDVDDKCYIKTEHDTGTRTHFLSGEGFNNVRGLTLTGSCSGRPGQLDDFTRNSEVPYDADCGPLATGPEGCYNWTDYYNTPISTIFCTSGEFWYRRDSNIRNTKTPIGYTPYKPWDDSVRAHMRQLNATRPIGSRDYAHRPGYRSLILSYERAKMILSNTDIHKGEVTYTGGRPFAANQYLVIFFKRPMTLLPGKYRITGGRSINPYNFAYPEKSSYQPWRNTYGSLHNRYTHDSRPGGTTNILWDKLPLYYCLNGVNHPSSMQSNSGHPPGWRAGGCRFGIHGYARMRGFGEFWNGEITRKVENVTAVFTNMVNKCSGDGGRYDNLIGDLGSNKKIPAVGAAINLND